MRTLPWTGRFDRVISWFTAFGYFNDAGNRQVLAEVARALKPGGRFALELQHRDWIVGALQPCVFSRRHPAHPHFVAIEDEVLDIAGLFKDH